MKKKKFIYHGVSEGAFCSDGRIWNYTQDAIKYRAVMRGWRALELQRQIAALGPSYPRTDRVLAK